MLLGPRPGSQRGRYRQVPNLNNDFKNSPDLQPVQSPALSFRTHSRTITSQRHLSHFWSTDGSLIGFLRVVVFAASNLLFTVRSRLPIIIRCPPMWLFSSAIHVPPSVGRASTSRRTSFGLLDLHLGHSLDVTVKSRSCMPAIGFST